MCILSRFSVLLGLEEQYDHLQKCDEQFRAFLTVAKVTLTDAVHNGDVGSKDFNVALIQADAEPITRLNRLETDINTRSQMRASLGSMLPTPNKPRGVNDIDLLRLSNPANTAASTKKKKRKPHDTTTLWNAASPSIAERWPPPACSSCPGTCPSA